MMKCSLWMGAVKWWLLPIFLAVVVMACSNDPYPDESDEGSDVFYTSFREAPHELDPQVAYSLGDMTYTRHCYEGLLDYEYLGRPPKLIPALAKSVPQAKIKKDKNGKVTEVRYSFNLREGVHFIDDACFENGKGREMDASDFEFAFQRLADPDVECPVFASFSHIKGMKAYREKIRSLRKTHGLDKVKPGKKPSMSTYELYKEVGKIPGIEVTGKYSFDMVLKDQYPVMLYWLSMRFICALPHEAVDFYYKGRESDTIEPEEFMHRPVGTGPYKFEWSSYNPEAKIVLTRNEKWWGRDRVAPTTRFPEKPGSPEDEKMGFWSKKDAGRKLCQLERIEFYMDKESLPRFGKFLQGYYDTAYVPQDKVTEVVAGAGDSVSPAMQAKGIRMTKEVGLNIRYLGFNMENKRVGSNDKSLSAEQKVKNRKLRQAMTMAFNVSELIRIFYPQTAIKAQSILPPGATGFDPNFRNPFKLYDKEPEKKLSAARKLLAEAGYPKGIDPKTGKPLVLTFTVGDTSAGGKLRYNHMINGWKKLGIDVKLDASDYNKFQDKVNEGNFEFTRWSWLADYRDPENFMFLLYGPNSGKNQPNYAQFKNKYYDALFKKMEALEDGQSAEVELKQADGSMKTTLLTRYQIIREMDRVLVKECPWVPILHNIDFVLQHKWVKNLKPHPHGPFYFQYYRLEPEVRKKARKAWNKPIYWPLGLIALAMCAFLVPAIITLKKERR